MKLRKALSLLLLICITVNTVVLSPAAVSADFDDFKDKYEITLADYDFEDGSIPDGLQISSGMGSVSVEEISGSKALTLRSGIEGGYTKAAENFRDVSSGRLDASFDFYQSEEGGENTLFSFVNEDNGMISVVTKQNSVRITCGGDEKEISNNFGLGTWHNIGVSVDLNQKTFSVKLDNDDSKALADINCAVSKVTGFCAVAGYTNGFAIDNILIKRVIDLSEGTISGENVISIPSAGERTYEYSVLLRDSSGGRIEDKNYDWSVDATTGISLSENDNGCVIKVTLDCAPGQITLTARHKTNTQAILMKNIELRTENANNIKITGNLHLTSFGGNESFFQYAVKVYDEFGNEMTEEPVEWYVKNESSANLSIDQTGKVCISGSMPRSDEYAYIGVRLPDSPTGMYAERKVVIQPNDLYYNDVMRFNAVKNSIDYILKYGGNANGSNPLLAAWFSPYTKQAGPIKYIGDKTYTKYSDLSMNFELHRAMDALSGFTGDETYTKRVDEMYKYYLDKGMSKDDLMYIGNHQSFDLDTGERSKYYTTVDDKHFMEIENRDFYAEPFLRNNKEKFVKFCDAFWANCFTDWGTMVFNRHTVIKEKPTNFTVLDNVDAFDEHAQDNEDFPFIPYIGLTFMSTGNILLKTARVAAENGGNQNLKLWGYRFIKRYMNTKNKDTNMFGSMFVSSKYAPGILDLEKNFGKNWWETKEGMEASRDYNAGDRGYNSFAQTVVDAGLKDAKGRVMTEDRKDEILEATLLENTSTFDRMSYEVYEFAEFLGFDKNTEEGREGRDIINNYTKCIASYIRNAYDPKTNKFDVIFTNGVKFTGVTWTRGGYWGAAGNSFKQRSMREGGLFTLMKVYQATEGYQDDGYPAEELEADREVIWNLLRNYLKYRYNIGDIGNPAKGIEPELNLGINNTDTLLVRVLLKLYDISGCKDYLKLARVVGNNIVVSKYKQNVFIDDNNLRYVPIDGEYQYVLLLLEQAILGEKGIVPESSYPNGYETQLSSISLVDNHELKWTNPEILDWSYRDVNVTDIVPNVSELNLEVGQKEKITLTIKPDDATSKGVFWEIKDKDIVSVNEANEVIGLAKGTTVISAVSKSTVGVESQKITVTVK